ncbi:unnamed protein product, partial [Clonostachys byssicola]
KTGATTKPDVKIPTPKAGDPVIVGVANWKLSGTGIDGTLDRIATTFESPARSAKLPPAHPVSSKLHYLSHHLHRRRDFSDLIGLDPENYTEEENVIIYGGVSSYYGYSSARVKVWPRKTGQNSHPVSSQARWYGCISRISRELNEKDTLSLCKKAEQDWLPTCDKKMLSKYFFGCLASTAGVSTRLPATCFSASGKTCSLISLVLRDPELAWRKPTARKLDVPQSIETVEHDEEIRHNFGMLAHH